MSSERRRDRWQQRYLDADGGAPMACAVLLEHACLLPPEGRALDLACGRGGNALYLARHGLSTEAWDYAPAAVDGLNALAAKQRLDLTALQRDVEKRPPEPDSFDVIAVRNFLCRPIAPRPYAGAHRFDA